MPNDFQFCPVCGSPPSPQSTPPQRNQPPPVQNYYQNNYYQNVIGLKSEGTTLILSIVLGLLIVQGIGHMYVGKIGKGVVILIVGLVLGVIGWTTIWIGVGAIFLIGNFILFIWQIIDSRNLCRQYNDYLSKNGKPPW